MPVFEDINTIFIHIPKCAGTSIIDNFANYSRVDLAPGEWVDIAVKPYRREANHLTFREMRALYTRVEWAKIARYYRFALVRNPWERSFSAWKYQALMYRKSGWFQYKKSALEENSFEAFMEDLLERHKKKVLYHSHDLPQYDYLTGRLGFRAVKYYSVDELTLAWREIQRSIKLVSDVLIESPLPKKNVSTGNGMEGIYNVRTSQIIRKIYCRDLSLAKFEPPKL